MFPLALSTPKRDRLKKIRGSQDYRPLNHYSISYCFLNSRVARVQIAASGWFCKRWMWSWRCKRTGLFAHGLSVDEKKSMSMKRCWSVMQTRRAWLNGFVYGAIWGWCDNGWHRTTLGTQFPYSISDNACPHSCSHTVGAFGDFQFLV